MNLLLMLFLIFYLLQWHSLHEPDIFNYPFLVKDKILKSIFEFSLIISVPLLFNDIEITSDFTWNIKANKINIIFVKL